MAALLAGAGVLLALVSFQDAEGPRPIAVDSGISAALLDGEVAVPVTLGSPTVASVLVAGDLVDLVTSATDGSSMVLATRARVLRTPPASGLSGASILVVAVDRSVGATLASASTENGGVAVIIRGDGEAAASTEAAAQ